MNNFPCIYSLLIYKLQERPKILNWCNWPERNRLKYDYDSTYIRDNIL